MRQEDNDTEEPQLGIYGSLWLVLTLIIKVLMCIYV